MDALSDYLATRRSDATRKLYGRVLRSLLSDPDAFLKLEKRSAEERLIGWAVSQRGTLKAYTVSVYLSIAKSFLLYYDVNLNWKRITSTVPQKRTVGLDRAPTAEEVRTALSFADLRDRTIILIMASSGTRLGPWKWLTVGDAKVLGSGLLLLTIYRREPEQYHALASPEAAAALAEYLSERRRAGEKVEPSSPLVRDKWDTEKAGETAAPISTGSIQSELRRIWIRAGLGKREFKMAHGFRKFFKTQAQRGIQNPDDVEVLMGHAKPYYKPTLEHLEEAYLPAVPFLSIDEKYRLKVEMDAKDREHSQGVKDLRLDYLTLKDELTEERKARERTDATLKAIMDNPELARKWKEHTREASPSPSDQGTA